MGWKGKDKGSAGFKAVWHSGSGSNVEKSKRRRSRLRHTGIRGANGYRRMEWQSMSIGVGMADTR
jgi:hypothetical protein